MAESYYSATFGVEAVRCPRKDGEVDEFDNPVSVAILVDVGGIVSMSVGFLPTSAKKHPETIAVALLAAAFGELTPEPSLRVVRAVDGYGDRVCKAH